MVESQVQWFIARDGKQHGPLSDAEMRKLVELGHLRPNDLLWRQGFTDWRPATSVFRSAGPGASAPTAPAEALAAAVTPKRPAFSAISGTTPSAPAESSAASVPRSRRPSTEESYDAARSTSHGGVRGSGNGRRLAIAAAVFAMLAGAGWAGYANRDRIMALAGMAPQDEGVPEIKRPTEPTKTASETQTALVAPSTKPLATTPAVSTTPALDNVDNELQKAPLWVFLKKEFPEWYGERVRDAARMSGEGKADADIARYMVEQLVGLRRQNADKALASSSNSLRSMANAFLGNLRHISGQSTDTCYEFISKGEASPPVIELMQSPANGQPIQAQLNAIFAAAVEGRATPVQHEAPRKEDYDLLAAELGKIGWSQADIQLFADPKALAQAPNARVCKMVQDWFTAHLAIADPGAQERLLFETLRPVVAG